MTKLTYLGHACFFFETEKAGILIDPWLTPDGAFLNTWRQLPPNTASLPWIMDKMRQKPVVVYVTHEHEDHYDEKTLAQILPLAAGFYIPSYENKFLKPLIKKNLSVDVTELDENVIVNFHDIDFKIFIEEGGINRDSAIFVKTDDLNFLNLNDCKIYDRAPWLKEQCGAVDIITTQFSGAIMHPICYDMTDEEYIAVSKQKRLRKFVAVRNFLKDMQPKCYIPSAGPAIFPFPEHAHLNFQEMSIFPKWWDFKNYLAEKGDTAPYYALDVLGSVTKDSSGTIAASGEAKIITADDMNEMIKFYRDVDAKKPKVNLPSYAEVIDFFEREMNKKIAVLHKNLDMKFATPLYFEITDKNHAPIMYMVHPSRCVLEKTTRDTMVAPYYLHVARTDAIGELMLSGKGWGTYFLSFKFRAARVPDEFDSALSTFFTANDADEFAFGLKKLIEFRDTDEYITLKSNDGKTEISCKRFCPHQGADLKYASFDGQHVICPRHQWKFDCLNGGKADKSSDTIDAKVITSTAKTGT